MDISEDPGGAQGKQSPEASAASLSGPAALCTDGLTSGISIETSEVAAASSVPEPWSPLLGAIRCHRGQAPASLPGSGHLLLLSDSCRSALSNRGPLGHHSAPSWGARSPSLNPQLFFVPRRAPHAPVPSTFLTGKFCYSSSVTQPDFSHVSHTSLLRFLFPLTRMLSPPQLLAPNASHIMSLCSVGGAV